MSPSASGQAAGNVLAASAGQSQYGAQQPATQPGSGAQQLTAESPYSEQAPVSRFGAGAQAPGRQFNAASQGQAFGSMGVEYGGPSVSY
jgi:hypothetical protein